mgnify:CR=1 FL=1
MPEHVQTDLQKSDGQKRKQRKTLASNVAQASWITDVYASDGPI